MAQRKSLILVGMTLLALVLGSCTLFERPTPITNLEDAIGVVVDDVLPDAVPAGATFLCARMDEPLPAGTVVEEDTPTQSLGVMSMPKSLTLREESFLFFLDLAPGMYYEHPVKFILVSRSGVRQVIDAVWWPRVEGSAVPEFRDLVADDPHVIAGNAIHAPTTRRLLQFSAFNLGAFARLQHEGFLVVQGLLQGEDFFNDATDTYLNGLAFFAAYRKTFSELKGLAQSDAAGVLSAIDTMAEKGLSPITIYVIAHGGIDGVRLGGAWITAQQFHDRFAAHPNTLFNFLLGSCRSGSFINDLNTLPNVKVVQTACAADGTASPDWDYYADLTDHNLEDSGSEWTSSILAAAATIVAEHWDGVVATSAAEDAPVTSFLFHAAGFGALGEYPDYGLVDDLDFSHRVGATNPQGYLGLAEGDI